MPPYKSLWAIALLALTNCSTVVQTYPARTATEELLISTASDHAAAKLALQIPEFSKVYIDNSNFEGIDSKYAMASIRSHLLQHGIHLIDDRKKADIIVETRAGALSMDRDTFLIGIPQFNIPIPLATGTLPFPEIAIYGYEEQKAIAKFAITGYKVNEGTLVDAQPPQYGFSHNTKKTLLIFISWKDSDYLPEDAETDSDQHSKMDDGNAQKVGPYLGINGDGYAPAQGAASSSTSSSNAPMPASPLPKLPF